MRTILFLLSIMLLTGTSCSSEASAQEKLYLTVNGHTLTATLVENSSTAALLEALRTAPITYEATDYGGFEKVGDLGRSFPTNDEPITTTAGDLILYQGRNLCIYYATNSWTFTRLGRINNVTASELKAILGTGTVTVTLTASDPSAVKSVTAAAAEEGRSYTVAGTPATENSKGIHIKNGKKILR